MSLIRWTEDLRIGIESIDAQHKQLIDLVNELHAALEHGSASELILPLMERLRQYAEVHFKEEEDLLEFHGFKEIDEHRLEHQSFVAKLDELKSRYPSEQEVLTLQARNFLLGWFYNHIKTDDMEYKNFLIKKGVVPASLETSGNRERKSG